MPLFNSHRTAKEKLDARRAELRKEGAERLQRERAAWKVKTDNGGTDAPEPTAETIDYR